VVRACSQGPEDYSQRAGLVDTLIKAKEDKAKEGRPASGKGSRPNTKVAAGRSQKVGCQYRFSVTPAAEDPSVSRIVHFESRHVNRQGEDCHADRRNSKSAVTAPSRQRRTGEPLAEAPVAAAAALVPTAAPVGPPRAAPGAAPACTVESVQKELDSLCGWVKVSTLMVFWLSSFVEAR